MIRFSDAMPDLLKDSKKALEQTRAILKFPCVKSQCDTDKFIKQNISIPSQVCDNAEVIQDEITDETDSLYKWL